jgi:hydrogenase-4 membrane subunit HyfE
MIVPRFRNVQISSLGLAYLSFILIVLSIACSIVSTFADDALILLASLAQLLGVSIFTVIMIRTLRIHPRLLRTADYFIALSVSVLLAMTLLQLLSQVAVVEVGGNGSSLIEVEMLLLFAILMIFGVEYKTLPSFLGFIRPRKNCLLFHLGLQSHPSFLVYPHCYMMTCCWLKYLILCCFPLS